VLRSFVPEARRSYVRGEVAKDGNTSAEIDVAETVRDVAEIVRAIEDAVPKIGPDLLDVTDFRFARADILLDVEDGVRERAEFVRDVADKLREIGSPIGAISSRVSVHLDFGRSPGE
jgi:hypothetical protein